MTGRASVRGGARCALLGILSALAIAPAAAAAPGCPALDRARAAMDATAGPAPDVLQRARDEAAARPGCGTDDRQQIDRWLALALLYKASAESQTYAEAEPLLQQAASIAGPWQVHAALGDAARHRRDFEPAARHYQRALQDIAVLADPASPYWDLPPADPIHAQLRRKADEMRLVAASFVSLPGRPACQIQSLGMWATQVVAPIRFVTDETSFTPAGEAAAEELFACLAALDPAEVTAITIIGHTDERGPDAYNQALSERRAERVRRYLRERGLKLPLRVEGRGERELFVPDSAVAYTREERWQMSRRVVVDVQRTGG